MKRDGHPGHDPLTANTIPVEEHLQDFVENAAIALHWIDEHGIIKWANKAELDLLGYNKAEYIGHHISEFHADQQKIADILHRLNCNETLKGYETRLRCKDGSEKTVSISSNVFWKDGKFIHTRCFTIDITEQKRAEQELLQTESRYSQLMHSLPAAMYSTDAEGRLMSYNKAAADLWGREPEIGVDLWCGSWKISKPDGSSLPLDLCPMAIALKEGRAVFGEEIIVIRPDGMARNVVPYPQPIFDLSGKMTGAINILVDITEIKRSENAVRESERKLRLFASSLEKTVAEKTASLQAKNEELKESEERYHKMIEEVEDYAILLLDKNGLIQNWNEGAKKIKGYTESEILGKNFRIFYLPEDQERGLPELLIEKAIKTGKALHEGWRLRKNGAHFWGSIVITALHDEQNRVIGFSKVTHDLSEKKIAEDKIIQYAAELESQNRELEQFAYAASHDLKEPLRKIQFYNNYVNDNYGSLLNDKAREYLNRAIQASDRMRQLIDDILAYAKTAAYLEPYEQVDINQIAKEIAVLHKDEVEQNQVLIDIGPLPVVQAIPFQFKQLLDNLIGNAIKYRHPERDCHILLRSRKVQGSQITESDAHPESWYHEISVIDNGTGFETQYAGKIFDIFHRLHNDTSASGSGIGLAICKKIMQNHNGWISATAQPGEGARFDLYLPAIEQTDYQENNRSYKEENRIIQY